MYCGAGTGCWARRATGGVDWFACPGVSRAPIVIRAKTSRQAFTNELRNCIARSPVEEFLAAIKPEGVRILSLSVRKRQVGGRNRGLGVGGWAERYVSGWMFLRTPQ